MAQKDEEEDGWPEHFVVDPRTIYRQRPGGVIAPHYQSIYTSTLTSSPKPPASEETEANNIANGKILPTTTAAIPQENNNITNSTDDENEMEKVDQNALTCPDDAERMDYVLRQLVEHVQPRAHRERVFAKIRQGVDDLEGIYFSMMLLGNDDDDDDDENDEDDEDEDDDDGASEAMVTKRKKTKGEKNNSSEELKIEEAKKKKSFSPKKRQEEAVSPPPIHYSFVKERLTAPFAAPSIGIWFDAVGETLGIGTLKCCGCGVHGHYY